MVSPTAVAPSKTSWADDADMDQDNDLPSPVSNTDANGITTLVFYKYNEDGQKVKVTRRFRSTVVKDTVARAVADRKKWARFGQAKAANDDAARRAEGENITLKLQAGNKGSSHEEEETAKLKAQLGDRKVVCRTCKGGHFTAHCPHKDLLGSLSSMGLDPANTGEQNKPDAAAAAAANPGVYIPVHKRNGGRTEDGRSEEPPTLRITNLSEDANDDDLRRICSRFGTVTRVHVGRTQEGLCKGFAFVSFAIKSDAEAAMKVINGLPYGYLILACTWSTPRGERERR